MRLVVDANVLFALAKPSSVANNLLSKHKLILLCPSFALFELSKHKEELVDKSGTNFSEVIKQLQDKVTFVDIAEYKDFIKKAVSLLPDPGDAAYLALALRLFIPIWSNDPHLKQQSLVRVFTTSELVELLAFQKSG